MNHSIVLARIEVPPQHRARVVETTHELVKASRGEPGVVSFQFHEVRGAPGTFVFYEVFDSMPSQDAHRRAAHTQAWFDEVLPLLASPPHIDQLQPATKEADHD